MTVREDVEGRQQRGAPQQVYSHLTTPIHNGSWRLAILEENKNLPMMFLIINNLALSGNYFPLLKYYYLLS